MERSNYSSLTKEPPVETLAAIVSSITEGMSYSDLRDLSARFDFKDAAPILHKRWLLIQGNQVAYDQFVQAAQSLNPMSSIMGKIWYFVWMFRDPRVRNFIIQYVADETGIWNSAKLRDLDGATYFRNHTQYTGDSANKARSNIFNYLVRWQIFDPVTNSVRLNLDDGWLSIAIGICSQHVSDEAQRKAMIADPLAYVLAEEWHPLLNLSREQAQANLYSQVPVEDALLEQQQEANIAKDTLREWKDRNAPHIVTGNNHLMVNSAALERAHASHLEMERMLAAKVKAAGATPMFNGQIDMYFETTAIVVAELKSCQKHSSHAQIRRAVAQLLEYKFYYEDDVGSSPQLLIITETKPPSQKEWLLDYLYSINFQLAWKQGQDFVTTQRLSPALNNIIITA